MRLITTAGVLVCLLSACAPAYNSPPAVTPIVRVISAQEAGSIVIDATNTAAAVATLNAVATSNESAARATSTSAWRATQDSAAALQTLTALDLTRAAGQAVATEGAGVKTQAAGQTATWGPPTLAAVSTRAAATAAALVHADQRATAEAAWHDSMRHAWDVGLLLVAALIFLAFGVAAAFGLSDILSALAELQKARAKVALAEALRLGVMQYGGALLQLKGQRWELMPPPQIAAPAAREPLSVTPAAGDVREVPIKAHQEVISTIQVGQAETLDRERVIGLLRSAIGATSGGARHIPPATMMSLHPMDWQSAVDQLKASADHPAYVEVRLGRPKAGENGTRLVHPNYRTLGLLLQGVLRGDVLPPPRPPTARDDD